MNKLRFVLLLLLSGCATSSGVCPQIRTYTCQEELNQAATESTLPPDSPLVQPLLEWSDLRGQLKACNHIPVHSCRNGGYN